MYDVETNLFDYRSRHYDTRLGLFTSRDPRTYEGSAWSLYRYVDNLPSSMVDPSGQQPDDPENYTCLISKEVYIKGARAASVCRHGSVSFEVFKNITDPCELYCTEVHETHHLIQIARICPDICCDANTGYPYFSDAEMLRNAECAAVQLNLDCLNSYRNGKRPDEETPSKLPIPFRRGPDPTQCDKEAIDERIRDLIEQFRMKYMCRTKGYKDPGKPTE